MPRTKEGKPSPVQKICFCSGGWGGKGKDSALICSPFTFPLQEPQRKQVGEKETDGHYSSFSGTEDGADWSVVHPLLHRNHMK